MLADGKATRTSFVVPLHTACLGVWPDYKRAKHQTTEDESGRADAVVQASFVGRYSTTPINVNEGLLFEVQVVTN